MQSRANTVWEGTLAEGAGETSFVSGAAGPLPVSWASRTEAAKGKTSPEELIAAAHASCFSMALSAGLGKSGTPPGRLETEAVCSFDKVPDGFKISSIALKVRGKVDGLDEAGFKKAAEGAKEGCPVSQALKGNVEITVDAALL